VTEQKIQKNFSTHLKHKGGWEQSVWTYKGEIMPDELNSLLWRDDLGKGDG